MPGAFRADGPGDSGVSRLNLLFSAFLPHLETDARRHSSPKSPGKLEHERRSLLRDPELQRRAAAGRCFRWSAPLNSRLRPPSANHDLSFRVFPESRPSAERFLLLPLFPAGV